LIIAREGIFLQFGSPLKELFRCSLKFYHEGNNNLELGKKVLLKFW